MKITKYITIACIVTSLSGCDYLDFDESIGKTQDEMYTYFENISSKATSPWGQAPLAVQRRFTHREFSKREIISQNIQKSPI